MVHSVLTVNDLINRTVNTLVLYELSSSKLSNSQLAQTHIGHNDGDFIEVGSEKKTCGTYLTLMVLNKTLFLYNKKMWPMLIIKRDFLFLMIRIVRASLQS